MRSNAAAACRCGAPLMKKEGGRLATLKCYLEITMLSRKKRPAPDTFQL